MIENILEYLPPALRTMIISYTSIEELNEIRIRASKKVILIFGNYEIITEYQASLKDILDILLKVSENSIYSIQNEINNGFVTLKGGHRVGVCGEVVIAEGNIKNIKNINGLNIRIAKQIRGCADKIMPYIVEKGDFKNTLIVSPPGCGKTTMLRDVIRQLSNGIERIKLRGSNIGVVDERGEIASVYHGIPGLDIGERTDVLSNCPKYQGIDMIVRSMGVQVVATDEIGSSNDCKAINEAALSGVKLVFTMHGSDISDVTRRGEISRLVQNGLFSNVIILSNKNGPGSIREIYKRNGTSDFEEVKGVF